MRNFTALAILAFSTCGIVGCGGGLGTVPAAGTVTVDGNAVEGVLVMFTPDDIENGMIASGVTDAAGAFTLTTEINGDGALPGTYKVSLSKYEETKDDGVPEDLDMESEEDMDAAYGALDKAGTEAESKAVIAQKWTTPATSGLTADVQKDVEGGNTFSFEVTAK